MTEFIHSELANGRWKTLTLCEQLGNVGSEVSRMIAAKKLHDEKRFEGAFVRMHELLYLTIADPKNNCRLKEICRARELLNDFFCGENEYQSTAENLDRYFTDFALAARQKHV